MIWSSDQWSCSFDMTHFLDESSLKTFPFDSLFSLYLIDDFIWNSEIERWVLQRNRQPMRVIHFIRTVQSGGKEFVTEVSNRLSIDWSTRCTPFLWAIYVQASLNWIRNFKGHYTNRSWRWFSTSSCSNCIQSRIQRLFWLFPSHYRKRRTFSGNWSKVTVFIKPDGS